jgi:hypothetical protein
MLFALLISVILAQTPPPQEPVQAVSSPAASTLQPAAPAQPLPAPSASTGKLADAVDAGSQGAEPEPEPEAEAPLPTRQVCRYVEVAGQRFPVRSCRTVVIEPAA